MKNIEVKEHATKVMFKMEIYDYEQGKRVALNKTFDKLNRNLQDAMALDTLGNLIVDALGAEELSDIIVIRQDSALV